MVFILLVCWSPGCKLGSVVGSPHKISFTMGFLKVQSWVQYSLCPVHSTTEVISHSRCRHHKFADAQHHLSSTPSDFHSLIADVEQCVDCQEMDDW